MQLPQVAVGLSDHECKVITKEFDHGTSTRTTTQLTFNRNGDLIESNQNQHSERFAYTDLRKKKETSYNFSQPAENAKILNDT